MKSRRVIQRKKRTSPNPSRDQLDALLDTVRSRRAQLAMSLEDAEIKGEDNRIVREIPYHIVRGR